MCRRTNESVTQRFCGQQRIEKKEEEMKVNEEGQRNIDSKTLRDTEKLRGKPTETEGRGASETIEVERISVDGRRRCVSQ